MKKAFIYTLSLFLTTIFWGCKIQPASWSPPLKPDFQGVYELNDDLSHGEKVHLLNYYGAEEFLVDKEGNIYCGSHVGEKDFSKGAIIKISPRNQAEIYLKTDSWITGMAFDKDENIIALLNGVGLIKISKDKKIDTLLTHTAPDEPILMGTGLKISTDGKIYFANMSTIQQTSWDYVNQIILEMKKTGGVFCYDPNTKKVETISAGNYFGNGLEISKNEDFILISETSRYRILKYWIKGEKRGTSEILLENLPGFPNNISRRENGNYWVGFTTKRNDQLDKAHPKPRIKKIIYAMPEFLKPKPEKFGMVAEITSEGDIVRCLFDPAGELVTESGALKEHNGHLYLGGDVVPYVSRIKL
ncbi:MAG: SMP-30/gluconolactonase/LRE family protein [Crocinitomicaceae bacterium]|nr:SMP-30/gluconolactonase/LRE family protein [Crocinitomicaceae bacterium]